MATEMNDTNGEGSPTLVDDQETTAAAAAAAAAAAVAAPPPQPQPQAQEATNDTGDTRVCVQGLSWSTTDDGLRNYMSQFGEIVDLIIMRDRMTHRSRGFGFLSFRDSQSAQKALGAMCELDGRRIEVKPAAARRQYGQAGAAAGMGGARAGEDIKIFVGGLHVQTTNEELLAAFEPYGTVVEAAVATDSHTGASRGFAFVNYKTEEALYKCLAAHAGSPMRFHGKLAEVRRAVPRPRAFAGGYGGGGGGGGMMGGGGYGGRYQGRSQGGGYYAPPQSGGALPYAYQQQQQQPDYSSAASYYEQAQQGGYGGGGGSYYPNAAAQVAPAGPAAASYGAMRGGALAAKRDVPKYHPYHR